MQTSGWQLESPLDAAAICALLDNSFAQVEVTQKQRHSYQLLDDFDTHLWAAGEQLLLLKKNATSASLQLLDATGAALQVEVIACLPIHVADLPESPLKEHLQRRVNVCALTAWLAVQEVQQRLVCRDASGKIRLRLSLIEQQIRRLDQPEIHTQQVLLLHPLRGYQADADKVRASLETALQRPLVAAPLLSLWLVSGLQPRQDRLPDPLPLDADMPAEQALREACRLMLAQARRYEHGLLADIDTEFLHQYRVNLRRIRSLISLLKGVLPAEVRQTLKQQLGELARTTNRLRDLDVFLQQRAVYQSWLPETFRPGLERVFQRVQQQRRKAWQQLVKDFQAAPYQQLLLQVEQQLVEPATLASPQSRMPLAQLAEKYIWKTYQQLVQLAQDITEATPDAEIHELRIECKKLRYLLDFFASLYPSAQIKRHVRALKELQTLLGDFNDYSVQQEALLQLLKTTQAAASQAALHGLISLLYQKQQLARGQVMQVLDNFCSPELQADFRQCYRGGRQ